MVIIRHLEDPAIEKLIQWARNPNSNSLPTVAVNLIGIVPKITKSTEEIIFAKLSPCQSYNPILVRRTSPRRPFLSY